MNTQITAQLSPDETNDFQRLETDIGESKDAFVRAGLALVEIRDRKLYREDFGTFEDYCQTRWGFSRVRGHQLMQAAQVVKEVSLLTTVNKIPNEATARELAKAPPEERASVVEAAQAAGKVTAKAVRAEVERRRPITKDEPGDEIRPTPDLEPIHTESGDKQIEMEVSMLANAFYNGVKKYHAKAIGLVWWQKTLERINQI